MTSISIYSASIPVTQSKLCTKCNTEKLLTEFSKAKISKDGHRSNCKVCDKEYRESHMKERLLYLKQYYSTHKIEAKQYRNDNFEKINARELKYAVDNPEKVAANANSKNAKRRATKLNATPKWAEFDLIKQLYIDCKLISKITSTQHQVDHIVPLQSEFVCGLHCIANLQILTATENLAKFNRYWPDMF